MSKQKRTIALDFDGVIHAYDGWKNGKISGPIDGARDAVVELIRRGQEVVIFSTRDPAMIQAWLAVHGFPQNLKITNVKEPFYVMVDDRAFRFNGQWTNDVVRDILKFEPYWILKRTNPCALGGSHRAWVRAIQDASPMLGHRPWPGAPMPVDPGTWRLKQWKVLGPGLRRYREANCITYKVLALSIRCPTHDYLNMERGRAPTLVYDLYFWAAWEFIDKRAYPATI